MKYKKPKVTLLQHSPLFVSEIAARVCYDSFGLSENESIRSFEQTEDRLKELQNQDINSSEILDKLTWAYFHASIVEHTSLSFFVQDLSREVLQEIVRHRVGTSFSVKSTRYTIEPLIDAFVDILENDTIETQEKFRNIVKNNIIVDDDKWIDIETTALYSKLKLYNQEEPLVKGLKGSRKKKQNDRVKRCLPETWMTKMVITFNIRSFKHFVELRDSGSAYFGIRELTENMMSQVPDKLMRYIKKPKDLKELEGH